MWQGLKTGERRAFSESFQLFRAEPHTFWLLKVKIKLFFVEVAQVILSDNPK
jgi:hypothetical protein